MLDEDQEMTFGGLPKLALFGHGARSGLDPLCAPKRTSAERSDCSGWSENGFHKCGGSSRDGKIVSDGFDGSSIAETLPSRAHEAPFHTAVPEARDGSRFNPGLKRAGAYRIGAKAHEEVFESFEAALARLREMPRPQWRRPNAQGNWGLVTGMRRIKLMGDYLKLPLPPVSKY